MGGKLAHRLKYLLICSIIFGCIFNKLCFICSNPYSIITGINNAFLMASIVMLHSLYVSGNISFKRIFVVFFRTFICLYLTIYFSVFYLCDISVFIELAGPSLATLTTFHFIDPRLLNPFPLTSISYLEWPRLVSRVLARAEHIAYRDGTNVAAADALREINATLNERQAFREYFQTVEGMSPNTGNRAIIWSWANQGARFRDMKRI